MLLRPLFKVGGTKSSGNKPFSRGNHPLCPRLQAGLGLWCRGRKPKETSFVARVSESLVFENENLIQENQVDIKEEMEGHSVISQVRLAGQNTIQGIPLYVRYIFAKLHLRIGAGELRGPLALECSSGATG